MGVQVTVCALGGQPKNVSASTVGEAKSKLGSEYANYTATVNGTPRNDDYELSDYQYVALTAPVKGGC